MSAGVWIILIVVAVLVLAEATARLWRRRHPTADRFARFRQWRIASSLWMLAAAGVLGVLVATHAVSLQH